MKYCSDCGLPQRPTRNPRDFGDSVDTRLRLLARELQKFPNDTLIKHQYLRLKAQTQGLTPEEEAEYAALVEPAIPRRAPPPLHEHPQRKALCRLIRRIRYQKDLLRSALTGGVGSAIKREYETHLTELQAMGLSNGFNQEDPNTWMYIRLTPAGEEAFKQHDGECDSWPDFRRRWY